MKRSLLNPFFGVAAGSFAIALSSQAATVLTGSGLTNNTLIPANHGSAATGTPNINLNWSSTVGTTGAANRWEAYNSWPNAGVGGQAYQLNGPNPWTGQTYSIEFTPSSAGFAVILTSVTLNDWAGSGTTTLNWAITSPTFPGNMASGTGLVVADGTAQTLFFNGPSSSIQGAAGQVLKLTFSPTAGSGSYFAIDNLTFDQVAAVPEASATALGALALGALALRRRRA